MSDEVEDVALDEEDMHGYASLFKGLIAAGALVMFGVVVGVVCLLVWGLK